MRLNGNENSRWKRWIEYALDEWRKARNDPVANWMFNPLGAMLFRTRWGRGLMWLMPIAMTRLLVLIVAWLPNVYAVSVAAPAWLLIATAVGGGVATAALLVHWGRQVRAWLQTRGKWQA